MKDRWADLAYVRRAVVFMNKLLKRPDEIFDLAKLYTLSVACTLLYGQRVADTDSLWYKDFYSLMEQVKDPGVYLILGIPKQQLTHAHSGLPLKNPEQILLLMIFLFSDSSQDNGRHGQTEFGGIWMICGPGQD